MIKFFNAILGFFTYSTSKIYNLSNSSFKKKIFTIQCLISQQNKEDIHELLAECIVKIEDIRFYEHNGVDFFSIGRAIRNNIIKRRKEGASTITQQLVRILIRKYEHTFSRKINEILLAAFIDNKFSKQQILNSYCHFYPFDYCKGISELFIHENINQDTLKHIEACQIAARFKYPYLNNANYSRYLKRVRIIEIAAKKVDKIV